MLSCTIRGLNVTLPRSAMRVVYIEYESNFYHSVGCARTVHTHVGLGSLHADTPDVIGHK